MMTATTENPDMTYPQASQILQDEFGLNLLECLDQVQMNLKHEIPTRPIVIKAYGHLMVGVMGGAA